MSCSISEAAFHLHRLTARVCSRSHCQELIAAGLGYQSYASYRASSGEPADWGNVAHVVVDPILIAQRQAALALAAPSSPPNWPVWRNAFGWADAVLQALTAVLPKGQVHDSESDCLDLMMPDIEVSISESGAFSSAQAETNTDGLPEFDLECVPMVPLAETDDNWLVDVSGHAQLDQDPDRVYSGDKVRVKAAVVLPKLGRRLLGEYELEEVSADVVDDYASDN